MLNENRAVNKINSISILNIVRISFMVWTNIIAACLWLGRGEVVILPLPLRPQK
jgi:hypothetical protein